MGPILGYRAIGWGAAERDKYSLGEVNFGVEGDFTHHLQLLIFLLRARVKFWSHERLAGTIGVGEKFRVPVVCQMLGETRPSYRSDDFNLPRPLGIRFRQMP